MWGSPFESSASDWWVQQPANIPTYVHSHTWSVNGITSDDWLHIYYEIVPRIVQWKLNREIEMIN